MLKKIKVEESSTDIENVYRSILSGGERLIVKDYLYYEDNVPERSVTGFIERDFKHFEMYVRAALCTRWPSFESSGVPVIWFEASISDLTVRPADRDSEYTLYIEGANIEDDEALIAEIRRVVPEDHKLRDELYRFATNKENQSLLSDSVTQIQQKDFERSI